MTTLTDLQKLPATPMWAQYASIKKDALDTLLFYRMGDFYELFLDDAVEASSILGITLTARNRNEDVPVPMCGVPFHSSGNYINRLLQAGKRVAICEQTEEAGATKGIVKREIVRIVSPGMALDPDTLDAHQNNFLLVLQLTDNSGAGAYCQAEISTGSIEYATFSSLDQLRDDLAWMQPKEIVIPTALEGTVHWNQFTHQVGQEYFNCVTTAPDFYFSPKNAKQDLCNHFQVLNLEGFGLHSDHPCLGVVGATYRRIRDTQKTASLHHLAPPAPKSREGFVQLDESTMEHLDLFPKANQNPADSVFHHINRTRTAMGARKLREILARPLLNKNAIEARQNAIKDLLNPFFIRELQEHLGGMRDIERLLSKIGLKTAGPRDAQALGDIFKRIPAIKQALTQNSKSPLLNSMNQQISAFADLEKIITQRLKEELPAVSREGNIFNSGWNSELDELIRLTDDGKSYLAEMENKEREKTGINSLKIKFNRVFGYFIEVTSANLANVPAHYIRKQTTANGERYLTDELKKFEDKMLSAQEKRIALEESLFQDLLNAIDLESQGILATAKQLAMLDVLAALAQSAADYGYCAPEILEESVCEIIEGRHPALEHVVGRDKFVANTTKFTATNKVFLITGPNMAGKSTYMRQVALITLLAHTGSYVPAKSARIGLVDRIATRVGASDRIGRGQSTFMVEMNEMARILRHSTNRSMLIIDEIGRGTSTYDGLALAWAILEDIDQRIQCRTLFATHYHELTLLEEQGANISNLCVAVEERNGDVMFLHEVRKGKAPGSYGIQVAKLAGLPLPVIDRAKTILGSLDKAAEKTQKHHKLPAQDKQLDLFSFSPSQLVQTKVETKIETKIIEKTPDHLLRLESQIKELNIDHCTPLEALLKLKNLKDTLLQ